MCFSPSKSQEVRIYFFDNFFEIISNFYFWLIEEEKFEYKWYSSVVDFA